MKALSFEIFLHQPVLVARPSSGDENSCESFNFIPGSALRGALISLYLSKKPGIEKDARRWFFSGEHCFLNAYPIRSEDRSRMLPRPLSWRVEKEEKYAESVNIKDFAIAEATDMASPVIPGSEYFQYQGESDIVMTDVRRTLIPHNASLIRYVKKADQNFVFQYEVLSAGQTLAAAITGLEVDQLNKELCLHNGQILFLGGSRSANYGRVELCNVQIHDTWQEYTQIGSPLDTEKLTITLLSDAIFLDKNGNQTITPSAYLHNCQPTAAFYKTRLVSGFNRKWGLPLPQAVAVMAGSVFVFQSSKVDLQKLDEYLQSGIGERRCEGFGRIALNLNTRPSWRRVELAEPIVTGKTLQELSAVSRKIAIRITANRLRSLLDTKVLQAISLITVSSPPNKSQLSQLRQAAKVSQAKGDLKDLRDALSQMKNKPKAQFSKARIQYSHNAEERFDEWLERGLKSDDINSNFWKLINPGKIQLVKGLCEEDIDLKPFQIEYIARFVEGVMQNIIRSMQQNSQEDEE